MLPTFAPHLVLKFVEAEVAAVVDLFDLAADPVVADLYSPPASPDPAYLFDPAFLGPSNSIMALPVDLS